MKRFSVFVQAVAAVVLLVWAVGMTVRLLAGGYAVFYVICFAVMALLGFMLLVQAVSEAKGGER